MESVNFLDAAALIVSAVVGAMGLGGGSVLILYLTMVRHLPQLVSQGINLLFFIPCAVTAVMIYDKQKIIQWKLVLPLILGGSVGVAIFPFRVADRPLTIQHPYQEGQHRRIHLNQVLLQ